MLKSHASRPRTRSKTSLGQMATSASPAAFTAFSSMPPEIQGRIWTYACEQYASLHARIQRVAKDKRPRRRDSKPPSQPAVLRILAPKRYPVPPLLHTCRKSREFALKHWTLLPYADVKRQHKQDGTYVYVNKAHDTFYFADGHIDDFLFLRCISRAAPPNSGLPTNDFNDAYDEFRLFLNGVRHFAIDWWCWLVETVEGDCLWMSLLCIAANEDLTVVINPYSSKPCMLEPHNLAPLIKEITPGTTRAMTVDIMLRHIKDNPDYAEGTKPPDMSDTQISKRGWEASEEPYREYMPNLNALAVIYSPSAEQDDENGEMDKRYLDEVSNQCRYHRLKATLESMSFEQDDLRKQMKENKTAFPDFSIHMFGGHRYR